jgi:hypothetical protein
VDLRRRRVPEPAAVSGPVIAEWQNQGLATGNYQSPSRPELPADFCPKCGAEVYRTPSGIPGASTKFSMVAVCEVHGPCEPVDQYGERH